MKFAQTRRHDERRGRRSLSTSLARSLKSHNGGRLREAVFESVESSIERTQEKAISRANHRIEESAVRALVLNSSFQPIKLVSWQKALILWFQGKVDVIEYHETSARAASTQFRLPSVMRLKRYVSPRRTARLKFSRENIYLRDQYTCQYCATRLPGKDLTLDHVVPASKFGRKDWTNVVTACRTCNHRKGNRTPIGAGMPLLNEPRIPSWLPVIQPYFRVENVPQEWLPYIGVG